MGLEFVFDHKKKKNFENTRDPEQEICFWVNRVMKYLCFSNEDDFKS